MLSKNIAVAGALLAGLTGLPFAQTTFAKDSADEASEYQMLTTAKVTAAEAAQAVSAQAGGRVSSVQIVEIGGKPMFHVEVVSGDKQQDYAVDAATGNVTQMLASEEKEDGEEHDDQE